MVATIHNTAAVRPALADHSGLVTHVVHCQENKKQKAFLPATGARPLRTAEELFSEPEKPDNIFLHLRLAAEAQADLRAD